MRKLRLVLLVLLLGLLVVAGYVFYFKLRGLDTSVSLPGGIENIDQSAPGKSAGTNEYPPGEVVITYGKSSMESDKYYRSAILNKVSVTEVERGSEAVDGRTVPKLDLTLQYIFRGKIRILLVSFVDRIFDPDAGAVVGVDEFEVKPGDQAGISFLYVYKGSSGGVADVKSMCEYTRNEICLLAIERGFGSRSVVFEDYLDTLGSEDAQNIDPMVIYPTSLRILRGI